MSSDQKSFYTARLLEIWALSAAQKNTLLANDNAEDRLLQIYGMLKLLFPYDKDPRNSWVSGPNKAFDGQAPIDVMLNAKVEGIDRVVKYLRDFVC